MRQVVKTFESSAGTFTALQGVDLQVAGGDFMAVIGKSGSGKSTLLNMMAAIDHPTSGEVWVNGSALHRFSEGQAAVWRGRNLGLVFQFFQLLPTLTAIETSCYRWISVTYTRTANVSSVLNICSGWLA